MHRIATGRDRQIHDTVGIQVASERFRTYVVGFISLFYMQCMPVCIGVDGDGRDTCLDAGTNDADSNFTTVGDQKFLYHLVCRSIDGECCLPYEFLRGE